VGEEGTCPCRERSTQLHSDATFLPHARGQTPVRNVPQSPLFPIYINERGTFTTRHVPLKSPVFGEPLFVQSSISHELRCVTRANPLTLD
jgi:hypothetical protein